MKFVTELMKKCICEVQTDFSLGATQEYAITQAVKNVNF